MTIKSNPCPKCGHLHRDDDARVMPGICPNCGIAMAKWQQRARPTEKQPAPDTLTIEPRETLLQRCHTQFLSVPEQVEPLEFYGRCALLLAFILWGGSFIIGGISWESIGGSFLHNIILPFHEFGHVLFSPFGRFMAILGGSLFQVLMPLGLLLAFSIQRRDNFAAAIMLWWCGQSFIDLSPYIADAPYRAIPLIRGMGESAHDWGNLLTMTNSLSSAQAIAQTAFFIGSMLMITAIVWGTYLLRQQHKNLTY